MIFNMTGAAGAPLNFAIVGNPKPENPKNNTIWIDTNDDITGWVFSSTQPETAEPGTVWICTSLVGNAAFNVLKKNAIMVCPFTASQYIGGEWVRKDAQSRQDGAWVDWIMYLYREGNDCYSLTGGYVTKYVSGDYGSPTIDFEETRIKFVNGGACHSIARTRDKIDLSGISKLILSIDGLTTSNNKDHSIRFFVASNEITNVSQSITDGASITYSCEANLVNVETDICLDVSAITGSRYVYVVDHSNARLATKSFYVREIQGEP